MVPLIFRPDVAPPVLLSKSAVQRNSTTLPAASLTASPHSDDVGVFQPHLAARTETKIFRRRILHEIILVDVKGSGEGHEARAGGGVFGIIDSGEFLRLVRGIICQDNFQRAQHGQPPQGPPV